MQSGIDWDEVDGKNHKHLVLTEYIPPPHPERRKKKKGIIIPPMRIKVVKIVWLIPCCVGRKHIKALGTYPDIQ